jgi:hypothetical protein
MHLSEHLAEQRLLRITRRAYATSAIAPRCKPTTHVLSAAAPVRREDESHSAAAAPAAAMDPISGDGIEGSRRRAPRSPVSGEIYVRRTGGFNFQAGLHDVSLGGCRVELIEPSEIGDHVITRFPALEPLGARVCWSAGVTAGVEFQAPVHPAVFDALLIRLQPPGA